MLIFINSSKFNIVTINWKILNNKYLYDIYPLIEYNDENTPQDIWFNKTNYFAKRFAAKEAFSKALGTGISKGINFNEIIVLNERNGKPYIKLIDKTKKIVEKKIKKKKYIISLSIADEKNYSTAFAIIQTS